VRHSPLDPVEKQDMIHERDAVVARLYNLSDAQLVHLFETFHEGWDYEERLKAVLKHFAKWGNGAVPVEKGRSLRARAERGAKQFRVRA
jgi:hypothetical protein